MMNKATCLSLLSNAVVVWNTVQMSHTLAQLRANGATIADEDLARVSPLAFAHVIPNGTYFVRQGQAEPGGPPCFVSQTARRALTGAYTPLRMLTVNFPAFAPGGP